MSELHISYEQYIYVCVCVWLRRGVEKSIAKLEEEEGEEEEEEEGVYSISFCENFSGRIGKNSPNPV